MILKVYDMNNWRKIFLDSWHNALRQRGEICIKPISIAVNNCVKL